MWTHNIFGHWTSGSCESSMSIFGWVLAWCVSGVNNVTDDFGAEFNRGLSFMYAFTSSGKLFRLFSRSGFLTQHNPQYSGST